MSTTPKDGGPAFPCPEKTTLFDESENPPVVKGFGGMSLRAWLAGQALAGHRATVNEQAANASAETVAAWCLHDADAIIAALAKPTT